MFRQSPALTTLVISVLLVAALGGGMYWYMYDPFKPRSEPIIVYCAETMRKPMDDIKALYEKETSQAVEIRYGPSQTILFQMKKSEDGDLFFPADESFIAPARKEGLLREVIPVGSLTAVVIVSPKAKTPVKTWTDFLAVGDKIGLANPEVAAIGKLTRTYLEKKGLWKELEKRKPDFLGNINLVANAVNRDTSTAGIVWDAIAKQFPDTKVVRLPELDGIEAQIQIAVTKDTKDPSHALHFARYVAAKNKGLGVFAKHDFRVADTADEFPDDPKDKPTLRLFGGSMLRPAIEKTVAEFAAREGVQIDTKFNGCGILLGEMKTYKEKGQDGYPDIFFACEPRFLKEAQENFGPADTVASNALVVAWRKERDLDITTFADLGQEGLRIGVGHENQCAMGVLTQEAFQFAKSSVKKVYANITMRAPAGDQLVLALRAIKGPDTLDVIVCYESNVKPFRSEFHYQPLNTILKDLPHECAYPDQPVAIRMDTKYPRLARRLLDAMQSTESKKRFEELGFTWKLDQGTRPKP